MRAVHAAEWTPVMSSSEGRVNPSDVASVVTSARSLELAPRTARWAHLSLCVIDATYSINAGYAGTSKTVYRYANFAGLSAVLLKGADLKEKVSPRGDEQSLTGFMDSIGDLSDDDTTAREVYNNLQRTSPRGGIRKAAAVRQIAKILVAHRIETLADVSALMTAPEHLGAVETDLAMVKGHGQALRMEYLWMTAGDDHHVKPDRHVLAWLKESVGRIVDVAEARKLLGEAAGILGVTPWVLDHAIKASDRAARHTGVEPGHPLRCGG